MDFAVRALKRAESLPRTISGRTVANQISRGGCSVAANYRSALRGKSRADVANKITIVLEESDETEFWAELTERDELLPASRLSSIRTDATELTRIFNATRSTARNHES